MKRKSRHIQSLQELFERHAQVDVKAWFDAYLKGAIHYRGLRTPLVRKLLTKWLREEEQRKVRLRLETLKGLAFELLEQPYAEDKFAGILLLEEEVLPRHSLDEKDFENFERLFQKAYLADWSSVDGFAIRVLSKIVQSYFDGEHKDIAKRLQQWAAQDNLWQARAAAVSLVRHAKKGEKNFPGFTALALDICNTLVRRPERFAQTAAGWLLRELSLADQRKAVSFIKKHVARMSSEGVRYATEKLSPELRAEMQELRKAPVKRGVKN